MLKRAIMLAGAALFAATAVQAQTVTLKFANFDLGTNPPQRLAFEPWAKQVEADSNGTLKIQFYPAGALGRDLRAQLEMLTNGIADIAWVVPAFTPGRFPDVAVTSIPFSYASSYEGTLASQRLYERGMFRGFDEVMVPMLFMLAAPPAIHATKPLPSVDALKGLKISARTDLQMRLLSQFGATPITGVNDANSAENMSRGVIEADLANFTGTVMFKTHELAKNVLRFPMGGTMLMVAMNKDAYAKLPPQAKAAVDKNKGMPFAKMWGKAIDGNEADIIARVKADPQRTWTELKPDEVKRIEGMLDPLIADFATRNDRARELVGAFREEVAKIRAGAYN